VIDLNVPSFAFFRASKLLTTDAAIKVTAPKSRPMGPNITEKALESGPASAMIPAMATA
jgi:hypothetical protein